MDAPKSLKLTMIGVFAALTIILSIVPLPSIGPINLVAILETLAGIVGSTLLLGAIGVTLGAIVYNIWKPSFFFLYFGFLTMATGVFSIALLMRRKGYLVLVLGAALLGLFLIAPGAAEVPLWTIWDNMLGVVLAVPSVLLVKKAFKPKLDKRWLFPAILLISFVGLEIDALMGNVLFTWFGYDLLGMSISDMTGAYTAVAFISVFERLAMAIISTIVCVPVVIAIDSNPRIRWLIRRDD
jgi:hypothetical protein